MSAFYSFRLPPEFPPVMDCHGYTVSMRLSVPSGHQPRGLTAYLHEDYTLYRETVDYRKAEERAEALLKQRLGRWQYQRFQWNQQLMRRSERWPTISYLIRRNRRLAVIENGHVKTELCLVIKKGEPEADRIMTILDLLESGREEQLWEMANVILPL